MSTAVSADYNHLSLTWFDHLLRGGGLSTTLNVYLDNDRWIMMVAWEFVVHQQQQFPLSRLVKRAQGNCRPCILRTERAEILHELVTSALNAGTTLICANPPTEAAKKSGLSDVQARHRQACSNTLAVHVIVLGSSTCLTSTSF